MAWTTDCKGFPEVGDPKLSKINHAKIEKTPHVWDAMEINIYDSYLASV